MLLIGLAGTQLAAQEKAWLRMPQVSGVVLFTRNFHSRDQLGELIADMRQLRPDDTFVVAVDQEGGAVQRFRDGFTRLPPLQVLGGHWDDSPQAALDLARQHAWVMASELRAMDVDFSFAPVLDLAGGNAAIGTRAFHADPTAVAELGKAYVHGMHEAGMAAVVKHYPGHGSVLADTHRTDAVDKQSLASLQERDLLPFRQTIAHGVEGVMMAHVKYSAVDAIPAGYSRRWIQDHLRRDMGFAGVVFGDDISMAAAGTVGDIAARINAHREAGCDLVLACQMDAVAFSLRATSGAAADADRPLSGLRGTRKPRWETLVRDPVYTKSLRELKAVMPA